MPIPLILANPSFLKIIDQTQPHLRVAEMFGRTLQGEGVSVGIPSVFLRLKNCTLDCVWCDSSSVWKFGNEYTIHELLDLLEKNGIVDDLRNKHHLILTGGSPLLQQNQLKDLLIAFYYKYKFHPYVEVENECVLDPSLEFLSLVDQWNNSPKLSNSGMKEKVRYKPELLKRMSELPNSWFKFVVDCEEDWEDINDYFLAPQLIKRDQIILMPQGQTQEELNQKRELVADMAVKYGVRFSDRLHITIWNKQTGV